MSALKRNWFIVGIFIVLGLAFVWPDGGKPGGIFGHPESGRIAVIVIFFFQGLLLHPSEIKAGLLRVRFHLSVQVFVFLICPITALLVMTALGDHLSGSAKAGIFFAAALPTAISTCLDFSLRAGGKRMEVITNIVLSNAFAILVTPLWMQWYMSTHLDGIDWLPAIRKLCVLIVLPICLGLISRVRLAEWGGRHARRIANFNSCLILFIIYGAFSSSVAGGVWSDFGGLQAVILVLTTVICLLLNMTLLSVLCFIFLKQYADQVSFFFTASSKSLAVGVPMAIALFGGDTGTGLMIVPLTVYAVSQFVLSGWLAGKFERAREIGNRGAKGAGA